MNIFFHSISGVLIVLVMIMLGFLLTKNNWFTKQSGFLIARFVTHISLPCYMVVTITEEFSNSMLYRMIPDLFVPVISMILLMFFSFFIATIFKVDKHHKGLFASMFFNSNVVFIGLPIDQALFGKESIPYVLIYYMANTTIFWTIGSYLIQQDNNKHIKLDFKRIMKKIFSPPLLGFIVGLFLVILKIELPQFIKSDLKYIGNMTIPLSMIFIGISISVSNSTKISFKKDNLLVIFGRFVCAPVLMILLVVHLNMPLLMKKVFIIQSAMPVMTNAPIVASLYNADVEYAAVMVFETTLISLIMIPLLMIIISL